MFEIEFTHSAHQDLKAARKFEQQIILAGIEEQLRFEPVETLHCKRLHPNDLAGWELPLGKYRGLYDVEEPANRVAIRAVGFKVGNELYIRNERRTL